MIWTRTDGLRSIFCSLENNRTRALRATIRTDVNISPDDVSRRAEQVLQILPSSLVRKLVDIVNAQILTRVIRIHTLPT